MDSIAVLPLDKASVVVPEADPPLIELLHSDGEHVHIHPSRDGGAKITRGFGDDDWSAPMEYNSVEEAVLAAADMQAFGTRRGGEPTNLFDARLQGGDPASAIEIEPLDRGGIVIKDDLYLPVVFHRTTGEYLRIRRDRPAEPPLLLEHRDDIVDDWDTIATVEADNAAEGAATLLDETDLDYVHPADGETVRPFLADAECSFTIAEQEELTDDIVAKASIQDRTLDFD